MTLVTSAYPDMAVELKGRRQANDPSAHPARGRRSCYLLPSAFYCWHPWVGAWLIVLKDARLRTAPADETASSARHSFPERGASAER